MQKSNVTVVLCHALAIPLTRQPINDGLQIHPDNCSLSAISEFYPNAFFKRAQAPRKLSTRRSEIFGGLYFYCWALSGYGSEGTDVRHEIGGDAITSQKANRTTWSITTEMNNQKVTRITVSDKSAGTLPRNKRWDVLDVTTDFWGEYTLAK